MSVLASSPVSSSQPPAVSFRKTFRVLTQLQFIEQTALDILSFLKDLKSPRTDEFRVACDSKFEKSTVFKLPAEQAGLKKKVKEAEIVPEESGKGEKEVMA